MENLGYLIIRAQKGDLSAYGALVQHFQPMAFRYAYAVLGDLHLAEDAVQEAFVEVYVQLPSLRYPAALSTWLRRIVFKHCDRLTRKKRLPIMPLEAVGDLVSDRIGPSEEMEHKWMCEQVMNALDNLAEFERRLVRLFYFDGHSQKEISTLLDLPVTTVKNRLHATRQHLRERMELIMKDHADLTDSAFAAELAQAALSHYAIEGAQLKFNWGKMRVTVSTGKPLNTFVLRFHYPAYMEMDEVWYKKETIESELIWLGALKRDLDLDGQEVVPNASGGFLTRLAGDGLRWPLYCTLLRKAKGDYVEDCFPSDAQTHNLGAMLARIHQHGSTWERPAGFFRPAWDWKFMNAFLMRMHPAVEEGLLSLDDFRIFEQFMARLKVIMDALGQGQEH